MVAGIAFHVVLGLFGVRKVIDYERPLWLMSFDYEGLQPYAVTLGKVEKGCAVCDESKVSELCV